MAKLAVALFVSALACSGLSSSLAFATQVPAPPPAAQPQQLAAQPQVLAAQPQVLAASAADILAEIRRQKSPVVVNLWATWCTPCREEFPDLMRFHKDFQARGVSLILVSGDFSSDTEAAREFLVSQGVDFRTYLKSGKDDEFINAFDPAWSGALPATFVYDDRGERVHSFLGTVTYDSLERVVAPLVGATPKAAPLAGAKAQ